MNFMKKQMNDEKLTKKEIAKKLGISASTLSFIANNKPGISEKTRQAVTKKIYDLGYDYIFKKETVTLSNICFVVYKRNGIVLGDSPFFLLLMESIEEYSRNNGFKIIISYMDAKEPFDQNVQYLKAMNPVGLIIFATEMLDEDIAKFQSLDIPTVFLDNDASRYQKDSVVINNETGTFLAVEHLVRQGHRKIGYLQSSAYIESFGERERGYLSALHHFGLNLDEKHHFRLSYSEEGSYQEFKQILNTKVDLPTAFLTDDDTIAAGAMKAISDAGLSIPRDLSIVGFSGRPLCEVASPKLTTISVPKNTFGILAVELLAKRIRQAYPNTGDYQKISVGVHLVIRESTRSI